MVDYLKSKKLIIKNEKLAIKIIDTYSYYAVVNTYKQIFKDNNKNYFPNTNFMEIYYLYKFDKNIKIIFLKYVLEIELKIKGIMANVLAKNYGLKDYLNKLNFDRFAKRENINKIVELIRIEINKNIGKHQAITHYYENYGFIPPFVLVKILSLGEISKLYGLLKQSDRQEISKIFSINDKLFKQILINLTLLRNICAHSDRLFTYRSKFVISFKLIDKTYKIDNNTTNLYMLIKSMKLFLTKNDYNLFVESLKKEYGVLSKSIESIDTNIILNIMGVPSNKI